MKRSTWAAPALAAMAAVVPLAASAASGATTTSVTLKQCTGEKLDRSVTYDTVPQRVFTIDAQSAEFMVALGLRDKIVSTWGMYGKDALKTTPEYAAQLKSIPVIGDTKTWPPPVEQIAAQKPDLVMTIYRLNIPGYLDAGRMESDLGIKTYGFTSTCNGGVMRNLNPVFADITNIGRIFHVEDRAAALIKKMKAKLAAAKKLTAHMPLCDAGGAGGTAPPGVLARPRARCRPLRTGTASNAVPPACPWPYGRNIFQDVKGAYAQVSWEQVVKRNPRVVWLHPRGSRLHPGRWRASQGHGEEPGLASVAGVKNKAFVALLPHRGRAERPQRRRGPGFARALHKLG
ncbi:MAG: ABC transporter substrate-binding protein [Thermoleophilia bacterium]